MSNDDSLMRNLLKHDATSGKLLFIITEPLFLTDPGHLIKCMTIPILTLGYLQLRVS